VLIDTHCHLGDPQFDLDRETTVARARAAGVGHAIVISDTAEASELAVTLARSLSLSATVGVHPHEASGWNVDVAERIAAALNDPVVVAVGETGLDYYYDHSPRPAQRRVFEAQMDLASQFEKPVVVHARDADDDMAAIVRERGTSVPALVLHSFCSGAVVFEAGMEVGAYFGFSGMVTFKNWDQFDVVKMCPSERLLLETDAPYLAPVPHRGKRNEPAFVRYVAERVADLRSEPLDALSQQTTANAERCFGSRMTEGNH
jgi:TatD DNase family protein